MPDVTPTPDTTNTPAAAPQKRSLLMRLLGIKRRPGKRLGYGPTKWGVVLMLGFVLFCAGAGFMEYTMTPGFCTSCHIMEPYHDAWAHSAHKDVNCIKCHFEPGLYGTLRGKFQASTQLVKYITGTQGSKPHAQVSNSSCQQSGCHSTPERLQKKIQWSVPGEDSGRKLPLNFDHTPHLDAKMGGKQLRCVSCHAQVSRDQHMSISVDSCFICHFKGVAENGQHDVKKGCVSCHNPPETVRLPTGEFDHASYVKNKVSCDNCHRDSIVGAGEVTKQSCWTCHNTKEQIAKFSDSEFIHKEHIGEHKLRCTNCHAQIQHSLKAKEALAATLRTSEKIRNAHSLTSANCGECHQTMHSGPKEIYLGTGAIGVPEMPSPMSRAQVDCIACHRAAKQTGAVAEIEGQTLLAVQASCTTCHSHKYDGTIEQWKQTVKTNLDNATAVYLRTQAIFNGLPAQDVRYPEAKRLMDEAEHNIRLVKEGHGVHNINYATAALNVAVERCQKVEKQLSGVEPVKPAPAGTTVPTTSQPATAPTVEKGGS